MRTEEKEILQDKNIINQHEWRVVGMSRSGNHSIINWMIRQLKGRYAFLNCAEPKTNPFYSARPLNQEKTYRTNISEFEPDLERKGVFTRKDYLIHSYEDCFPGMLNKAFEEHHDSFVGTTGNWLDILILRDPFNLFASRMKSGLFKRKKGSVSKPVTPLTALRIWKQHAREFLGEKKFLRKGRVVINYNQWAFNYEYRKSIATALGINFSDSGIREVSKVAGGSSFDGLQYADSADNMKVLDRWKYFQHDREYRRIFDEEMISLSERIFGPVPDQSLLSIPA